MAAPAFIGKLKDQLRGVYGGMSRRGRWISGLTLGLTVAVLAFVIGVDHTTYTALFSGLSREDAAAITQALKKERAPYQLQAGGTAILVPQDQVHELRLRLASQGLPRASGVGFEIFDNQKFGTSDFAQQINYRRALQGELERTIQQVDAVKSARVHIAMPKQQVFTRKQQPPSASVTLRLQPGRLLAQSGVRSIVHLVSSAVSGLSAEQISIMDTSGRLLWGGKESVQRYAGVSGFFDYQQRVESQLERRVAEILDRALGEGRSVVKVTAEMVMSRVEQTEEVYDPDQVAVRSETQAEELTGKPAVSEGVAGTRGNIPGGPQPKKAGSGQHTRKQLTRNYEVTKTVRRRTDPAGKLRRISVAVLIDDGAVTGGRPADAPNPTGAKSLALAKGARRTVDLAALESVVKQAVGFNERRGDVVALRAVPFAPERSQEAGPASPLVRLVQQRPWVLLAAAAGAALLLLTVVVLVVFGRRRKSTNSTEVANLPLSVRELERRGADNDEPLTGGARLVDDPALAGGGQQARELAEAAAMHDARRAAQVLRAWMAGG